MSDASEETATKLGPPAVPITSAPPERESLNTAPVWPCSVLVTSPLPTSHIFTVVVHPVGGHERWEVQVPVASIALHLLLAEDGLVNQKVAVHLLGQRGHRVTVVSNGREALEALAAGGTPFDAILMDVQLPEMDGLQATRILQTDPTTAHIPIIAVTAHVKPDDAKRCLDAGCALHLPKPLDTRQLPEIVARTIDSATERTG